MTPDRDESTPVDHGMLADPGNIDPTGIDFGAGMTAQVSLVLPSHDEEDDTADDVVDGEVVTGEHPLVAEPTNTASTDTDTETAEVVEEDAEPGQDQTVQDTAGPERAPRIDEWVAAHAMMRNPAEQTDPVEAPAPEHHADAATFEPEEDAIVDETAHEVPDDTAADPSERSIERADERVRTPAPEPVTFVSKRLGELDESRRESADLLTPDRLLEPGHAHTSEPEGLWQQLVYAITFRLINLGDSKKVRARKELAARIAAPLPGPARFVPVLSRKGGVGKTTVTALLGMALADARDDRVIAVDANPDRGTLADRIARASGRTVRDLARARADVTGFGDISAIVARDQTRLDVLASDADPHVSEAFNDGDYADVAELAAHYYSVVLTDTGTGIVHSVMGATLERADQLVIVAGLSVDEARLASETLTWLETNGYAEQVRQAVVVLNTARPGTPLVRADELEAHFRSRVREVVRVPYDPSIASGSSIVFRDLQPETQRAARELAAAVISGLRTGAALV